MDKEQPRRSKNTTSKKRTADIIPVFRRETTSLPCRWEPRECDLCMITICQEWYPNMYFHIGIICISFQGLAFIPKALTLPVSFLLSHVITIIWEWPHHYPYWSVFTHLPQVLAASERHLTVMLHQHVYVTLRTKLNATLWGIRCTRTPYNSYPDQLVPKPTRTQVTHFWPTRTQTNSYPGHPLLANSYPNQLVPRSPTSDQLVPKPTRFTPTGTLFLVYLPIIDQTIKIIHVLVLNWIELFFISLLNWIVLYFIMGLQSGIIWFKMEMSLG